MTQSHWSTKDLDLSAYLVRIGVSRRAPSLSALGELYEAHVRTFFFDNIDVLLDQHPGVGLAEVQEKFVGRGRGGYCFEHATLFAAALDELGYSVARRLGRVGTQARTHAVVTVAIDGRKFLTDPGFTLTISRPIELRNGARAEQGGWEFQVRKAALGPVGGWQLYRRNGQSWDHLHTHDELPVLPVDFVAGHHFTSTHPDVHFRQRLIVSRHVDDAHITLSHEAVTIRRPHQRTARTALEIADVVAWLGKLGMTLSDREQQSLVATLSGLRG